MDEFVFAVWICAQPFADAVEKINDRSVVKDCYRWGRKARKMDFKEHLEVFDEYIANHSDCPPRWDMPGKQSSGPRVPWQLAMVWNMCSGQVDESLWDMSLGRAIAYSSARASALGDDSLISDAEQEIINGAG